MLFAFYFAKMRENKKKREVLMEENKRGSFSGRLGFVLSAAGSAVGLGNIWRFPYLAAKYGGGIFLLVYLVLSLTFGFSLMIAEVAIGRRTGQSSVGAYASLNRRFAFLGYIATLLPILILPYYSVIGGWVIKYAVGYVFGMGDTIGGAGYYESYISRPVEPIVWLAVFALLTGAIVLLGVKGGVEKLSKLMMPALVILMVFLVIYTAFGIEGSLRGVIYYLTPDISRLSPMTFVAATGQLFYSMSLAMGTMITFGSYMKSDINIERCVHHIEIFDTGIAFLSGLLVISAVFAFSGGESVGVGPGLVFETLPLVFRSLPFGKTVGALFFIMVLFAALTSSVSMMETVVSVLIDKLKLSRPLAVISMLCAVVLLGIPSALGYSIWSEVRILGQTVLDFFDMFTNNLIMPTVAIIGTVFVGYVIKPNFVISEVEKNGTFHAARMFSFVIRYAAPVMLLLILITSVLNVFGVITI